MSSSSFPFFFFLLLLLLSSLSLVTPSLDSETSALLHLRSGLLRPGRTREWNTSVHTCLWRGVTCDSSNTTVTSLVLRGFSLVGIIPPGVFGNLTSLAILRLRFNSLASPLPSDISFCKNLQQLNLENNSFSEPFPSSILSLTSLTNLVLSGNSFSGRIPADLSTLRNLTILYLDRNRFTGPLPDLNLPGLSNFSVSFNPLNGSIPTNIRRFPSDSFAGTSLCGGPDPLPACPGEGNATNSGKKLSGGAIAGIVAASAAIVLVVLLGVFWYCARKGGDGSKVAVADPEAAPVSREAVQRKPVEAKRLSVFKVEEKFELEDLLRASAEVLGKGTLGTTYKATLESGQVVVVKRLRDSTLAEGEFRSRVEAIAALRHGNLVELKALHYSKEEKLLVYAYSPRGSLSALLHGNKGTGRVPLIWDTRLNVALTTARGIEYIHSKGPDSCHGNIKSSNILLTEFNHAMVSEHGLLQLATPNSTTNRATVYRAPELRQPQVATQTGDVYSFGILLLELLTGREPGLAVQEEGMDLLKWVLMFPRDEWSSEVFDMELLRFQNSEEEMVELLQLAIDCCRQVAASRPTMSEVAKQIAEIQHASAEQTTVEMDSDDGSPHEPRDHQ